MLERLRNSWLKMYPNVSQIVGLSQRQSDVAIGGSWVSKTVIQLEQECCNRSMCSSGRALRLCLGRWQSGIDVHPSVITGCTDWTWREAIKELYKIALYGGKYRSFFFTHCCPWVERMDLNCIHGDYLHSFTQEKQWLWPSSTANLLSLLQQLIPTLMPAHHHGILLQLEQRKHLLDSSPVVQRSVYSMFNCVCLWR